MPWLSVLLTILTSVWTTPPPPEHIFSKSDGKSEISFLVICWGSSIRGSDLKKLNKLIKKADSVLEPLELILLRRILHNEEQS